eukprot:CAMPEP_0170169468 /NCGR_PEP_ID=MMETSP0040_2-20121228/2389_1 /TAXON_ID=641309 /ORGANISM="Lotharella oceanica, Strain CCMP622" /LENGTH=77 /DNA_ID=CAMNT_0010408233 /DNA_START=15 /DNA_END=248 /DNA_ORIENTATION=-
MSLPASRASRSLRVLFRPFSSKTIVNSPKKRRPDTTRSDVGDECRDFLNKLATAVREHKDMPEKKDHFRDFLKMAKE